LNFCRPMTSGCRFNGTHSSEARVNRSALPSVRAFVFIFVFTQRWLVTFIFNRL
jgi:hypothetical protein